MQKKLNLKTKSTERVLDHSPLQFLEEDYSKFFEGEIVSPYMLMVKKVKNQKYN